MFTRERHTRVVGWCALAALISWLPPTAVWAQGTEPAWQREYRLDVALGVDLDPIQQPLLIPGERLGAPRWPLYKQEPPGAQSDFRPAPAPVVAEPAPQPAPAPQPESEPEPEPEPAPAPAPSPEPAPALSPDPSESAGF